MEASITKRLADLREMKLPQLRAEYEKLFGRPSKSRNRKQLFSQVARKIQADRAGQKATDKPVKPTLTVKFEPRRKSKKAAGKKAKAKTKRTSTEKTPRTKAIGLRDPRLPKVGTTITREWHGKKYLVRVCDQGFEYDSRPFRSLSGVAKAITGQIINGYFFFGLLDKGSEKR